MSYLAELTLRLAAGATRLPQTTRRRHAGFFAAGQNDDGGFAGRQGPSDVYYTSFALRGLALLGELTDAIGAAAAGFLGRDLGRQASGVDFVALVSSCVLVEMTVGIDVFAEAGLDRRQTVAHALDRLRRPDGGYAKNDRSPHSSTYHTFLAAACRQLADLPVEEPAKMIALVGSRRRDDGGFVELAPLRQSGTNPTAAAVALLRLLAGLDEPIGVGASRFLLGMQGAEGGWRANTRVPVADLLSTFTGLVALADLGALPEARRGEARRYVESLERPEGGFRGGAWDDAADVEYAFYGLGALAILAAPDR
jgi:geranylgeranyl transferase type-2 subunit beta